MLHELLFALNGHHGHIFMLQGGKFKVNDALPYFHPAEVGILNQLLDIATDFYKVECFINEHRNVTMEYTEKGTALSKAGEGKLHGLYLEALCDGLDNALNSYRYAIADLEKMILKANGETQLSQIQHRIHPFLPTMRALHSLVNQVKIQKSHGCLILDVIYRASCSGVAEVRETMQSILHEGHKVFYKQLLAWILKGSLHDPYHEFIIEEIKDHDSQNLLVSQELASEIKSSQSSSQNMSAISVSSGMSFASTNSSEDGSTVSSNQRQCKPGMKRFKLRVDKIPSHISITIAEKVFFIGESIQLFETSRKLDFDFHSDKNFTMDVLKDKEALFYDQLSLLRENEEFRLADFERFVDSVRETVSQHLHTLMMHKADLKSELENIRNFFLLGRGELYVTFIEEADRFLRIQPSAATQHDVHEAFASACRHILGHEEESVLRKIKIKIALKTKIKIGSGSNAHDSSSVHMANLRSSASNRPTDGWQCFSLQYSVSWPLHLVITPSVIDKYNDILKFLLYVRRTQCKLHETWANQKKIEVKMTDSWQLRTHMIFIVDNLQHYLMADVLESQYSVLMKKLDQSTNFEEIRHSHDVFLSTITSHTFINNKSVNHCLSELLKACQQYCDHVNGVKVVSTEETEAEKFIGSLALNFSRQSGLLFKLLTSVQNRTTGTKLAQLLLRIDYNRYFSKHGHDIGSITA